MKYLVLYGISPDDLAKQVEEHMSLGWCPLGGVSVTSDVGVFSYFQAMLLTKSMAILMAKEPA